MTDKIEIDVECSTCRGTGIYTGMCERDGAAVVCKRCGGTGKVHVSLTPFEGRRTRENIKRVFEINPGFIGLGDDASDGGIPYADWLAGKPFPPGSENRKCMCPYWWFQLTDYNNQPDWDACHGPKSLNRIDHCAHFKQKDQCWARWDEEHAA